MSDRNPEAAQDRNAPPLVRLEGWLLLILVILFSYAFLKSPGTGDVSIHAQWQSRFESEGLVEAYRNNDDCYPPLALVFLSNFRMAARALDMDPKLAFKCGLLCFAVFSTLIILAWTRRPEFAALFHASLLLNTMGLGYLDIMFTPTLLLALWALRMDRPAWLGVFLAISLLTKWQPIVIAPFLIMALSKVDSGGIFKPNFRGLLITSGIVVSAVIACRTWFGPAFTRAFQAASVAHWQWSPNSLNAWRIASPFAHWLFPDRFSPTSGAIGHLPALALEVQIGSLTFQAVCLGLGLLYIRRKRSFADTLRFTWAGFTTYCMVCTGVHENHLYMSQILSLLLFFEDRSTWRTAAAWALIGNMNLVIFYGINGRGLGMNILVGVDVTFVLSIAAVTIYLTQMASLLRDELFAKGVSFPTPTPPSA